MQLTAFWRFVFRCISRVSCCFSGLLQLRLSQFFRSQGSSVFQLCSMRSTAFHASTLWGSQHFLWCHLLGNALRIDAIGKQWAGNTPKKLESEGSVQEKDMQLEDVPETDWAAGHTA